MASFVFDVLPCCEISDHDGPYIGIKVRMKQYQPRFKYICDNSNRKRYLAHLTQKISDWTAYRAVQNKFKHAIRTTKKKFLTSTLSDKRPRSIWRYIHRILKPKNQTILMMILC